MKRPIYSGYDGNVGNNHLFLCINPMSTMIPLSNDMDAKNSLTRQTTRRRNYDNNANPHLID